MLNRVDSNKTFTDLYGDHLNNVVVFGNPDNTKDFEAHVKMQFWGEDTICLCEEGVKGTPVLKDEVLELDLGTRKLQWYKGDRPKWGSIHWKETLNEKPVSNKWSLKIADAGQFTYDYQTSLVKKALSIPGSRIEYYQKNGEDWIKLIYPDGCFDARPLDVEGSIAVYHKTKQFNILGHKNYRGGKVLHILRPKAVGANNKWVWCDIKVENGVYTRIVPWSLLDDPTAHPIVINDTFGYWSSGGTESGLGENRIAAFGPHACPSAGTATSVHFYLTSLDNDNMTFGFYNDYEDYPSTLQADSAGAVENTDGWCTQNLDSPTAVTAQNYYIAAKSQTDIPSYWYDEVADFERNFVNEGAYTQGVLTSPFPAGATVSGTRKYSAYITYTPSAAGIEILRRRMEE